MRNHVMVRVGGGWDTLENYIQKHDPCRGGGKEMYRCKVCNYSRINHIKCSYSPAICTKKEDIRAVTKDNEGDIRYPARLSRWSSRSDVQLGLKDMFEKLKGCKNCRSLRQEILHGVSSEDR